MLARNRWSFLDCRTISLQILRLRGPGRTDHFRYAKSQSQLVALGKFPPAKKVTGIAMSPE